MKSLGEKLKEKRINLRLTQQLLAELSGVSRSYIVEIEGEIHNNISISILCDLCKVLNCTPNDLIPEELYT